VREREVVEDQQLSWLYQYLVDHGLQLKALTREKGRLGVKGRQLQTTPETRFGTHTGSASAKPYVASTTRAKLPST
jgi:hypothetical protein